MQDEHYGGEGKNEVVFLLPLIILKCGTLQK